MGVSMWMNDIQERNYIKIQDKSIQDDKYSF
jgi:hypothetical protein